MSSEQLNVIALVSGGKDSFFSALHCQRNGHRLVALANLFPSASVSAGSDATRSAPGTIVYEPKGDHVKDAQEQEEGAKAGNRADDDADLNSFMYQTVGHQVIPLYADATGLPLYRQPIYGGAKYEGRDYDSQAVSTRDGDAAPETDADETESMVPLLRAIMADHPEANALCAGAILSTYQRTRVESVALRLGLTPLAYLWKYPVLPPVIPGAVEEAQLLHDMAAAGLDARIIKVASAGLDDDFLWEKVSSIAGAARVKRALRKFGAAEGSVIGEGGEFETLVLDGPPSLFRKAIEVPESGRRVVKEGGGTSWLSFQGASVREKPTPETDSGESCPPPRVPDVLDPRFQSLLDALPPAQEALSGEGFAKGDGNVSASSKAPSDDIHWSFAAKAAEDQNLSVEEQTEEIVRQVHKRLADHSPPLPTTAITNTVIALSSMSDFPAVNKIYSKLFQHPNPPSRVTISCSGFQAGSAINIHLTVKPNLEPRERNGLHVQSRSYWAPANIGPYSQAIDVPLSNQAAPSQGEQEAGQAGVRSVAIAGQIPLVPASMILPTETTGNLEMQIILSLQHLWRIATEMKVQLWTSAVAYFPHTPEEADKRRQSHLAAAAWKGAHAPDEDEDGDNEGGPDLWDRKFNPAYMSLGDDAAAPQKLPDWSVVKGATEEDEGEGKKPVPPFFAVEVEELPRQAGVEWHAHLGLWRLASSSVEYQTFDLEPSPTEPFYRRVCHVVVSGMLVHTTISWLARRGAGARPPTSFSDISEWMGRAYLKSIGSEQHTSEAGFAYLMYLNVSECTSAAEAPAGEGKDQDRTTAYIKAKSIYDENGGLVLAVGLWK
ncbi:diphthine--ammonia ligase [Colletotrichum spaethianum]|uniref:Diphthine--ammonia ligase n=1 Tax=Colletotrichum spaethianum TaxID=700344 RepID=A0AA37L592_9PEZI|nr:diphthine--ammonia ligase [Colletotrichum spaethianum]GKT42133.1 diphthine--ammonia ligase [Colletotrichum spaethianum]